MSSQGIATLNHHSNFHPEFQHRLIWGRGRREILYVESTVIFYHFVFTLFVVTLLCSLSVCIFSFFYLNSETP